MKRRIETIDLTDGSHLFRNLALFVLPLMLTGILQLLYTASDLIVCGSFGSGHSTAAISSTNALINLIVNLFLGFGIGSNVLMARAFGAGDAEKGQRVAYTAMISAAVFGVLIGAFGAGLSRYFLQWMRTDAEVIALSTQYLTVYFFGVPFLMIYNFGAALLRAVGDTKRPFYFLMAAGVVNVLLNLLFVIVFHLDVLGVAICTDISQFLCAALTVLYLLRYRGFFHFHLRELRFYPKEAFEIIRIGLPAGIQSAIFSVSNVVIQSSVNGLGVDVVDGNGASASLEGFLFTCMNATSQGTVSFASANYGAKNKANIRRTFVASICLILIVNVFFGVPMFLLRRPLVGLYVKTEAGIEEGARRLVVLLLSAWICGVMDIPASTLRAIGYSTLPMLVTLFGVVGLRFVWIFLVFPIPALHNLVGIALSYPASWIITALVHFTCFFVLFGKLRFPSPEEQRL